MSRVGSLAPLCGLLLGIGQLCCELPEPIERGSATPASVGRYIDLSSHRTRGSELLGALARASKPGAATPLNVHRAEIVDLSETRLLLRSHGGGNGYLEWAADLDANGVFELELAASVDRPCVLRFLWRRADEAFAFEQSVAWPMPVPGEHRSRRTLRGRPGFSQQIVAVRLQIESQDPVRVEVEDLLSSGWDRDLALDEVSDGSLVSLRFGSEVRPSFLLHPGEERVSSIPAGHWQLRGAAIHAGATRQDLKLVLSDTSGVIGSQTIHVEPVAPKEQSIYWTPIEWEVEIAEQAELTYTIESTGDPRFVVVAALKAVPRIDEAAPRAVLVSLDTVRADTLGIYGAEGNPSPRLDRLARRSWVFDRAFSTSSWTLPSHMSLLTGYWPARHTIEGGGRSYSGHSWTLAQGLRDAGYWTEAWTEGGFVDPRFGFAHGFDRYVVLPTNHLMAESVEGSLRSLETVRGPAFLFLHTYQAHAPYDPEPEAFARYAGREDIDGLPSRTELWNWMEAWRRDEQRLPAEQLDLLEAAYRAGIPRVDRLMEVFLDGLDSLGPASPDVLIVTSDHGEVFQERSTLLEHGRELYPELLAVPLIVSTGDPGATGRRSEVASIADVPATLLDLLGQPAPPSDGRALLSGAMNGPSLRTRVKAAVQPPFTAAYRFASVSADHVDAIEVGHEVGVGRRYSNDVSAERPHFAAPAERADLPAIERAWADDHRGRTEIALRFEEPRSELRLRVLSSGRIIDAIALPSVSAALRKAGSSEVQIDLTPTQPTRWVSLLLETDPPDAGLMIEIPERAGPLRWSCGARDDVQDAARCSRALDEVGGPVATFAEDPGGWIRIVRHPGVPFRSASVSLGEELAAAPVDPVLARQLEALGYAGVEVGTGGEEDLDPARGEILPGRVAVLRTESP
ncbi:MAG: hypothetical protein CL908_23625 [Deltaproteobacteria bacterium]|nr:hypothetical protein [Deltaproteobacteria bacterium]